MWLPMYLIQEGEAAAILEVPFQRKHSSLLLITTSSIFILLGMF